ncbi:hypothetical protein AADA15_05010, partial [Phycobacter sp. 'Weihai']
MPGVVASLPGIVLRSFVVSMPYRCGVNFLVESGQKAKTPLDLTRGLRILHPNVRQRCWTGSER